MFINIQIPSLYSGFINSENTLEVKESLFSKACQRPLQPGPRLILSTGNYYILNTEETQKGSLLF